MIRLRWLALLSLYSLTSLATVGMDEKMERVKFIQKLSEKNNIFNSDSLLRDLNYEQQSLSLEARAEAEANLNAEKIRSEIALTFDAAVERLGSREEAAREIKESLANEFQLATPELREELIKFATDTVDEIKNGFVNHEVRLEVLETSLLKELSQRSLVLNSKNLGDKKILDKTGYNSKAELLDALVFGDANVPYISSANTSVKSTVLKKSEHEIKLKVNLEFKGASINAGPSISFKREYSSQVNISAEGLYPLFLPDGNFDLIKRDRTGRPVMKDGKTVRRTVTFTCEAGLSFETSDELSAGISFVLPGYDYTYERRFSNRVDFSSSQAFLPEYLSGSAVTMKFLSGLCHNDFLNAKLATNMTVTDSLNATMKNMIASLRIRNAKTKCVYDSHCFAWFNNLGMVRVNNVPRCILDETSGEFAYCSLRGLRGQACAVIENGKRVSDGYFERICDTGLTCRKVSNGGWLQEGILGRVWTAPKGQCL